jgi:hypothetical protein
MFGLSYVEVELKSRGVKKYRKIGTGIGTGKPRN